jgi:unsaturated rhamnogalacturonyl hydrolase
MWLDSLYMAGPLMSEYAKRFDRPDIANQVVFQAKLMYEMTADDETGLLYHAWDARKVAKWADPETGKSSEFWGRAIGWVPVALLDDADHFDPGSPDHQTLVDLALKVLRAVNPYRSKDGRWYQVIDKGDRPDNWLENSASSLFIAAIAKAIIQGYVTGSEAERWRQIAWKGFHSITRDFDWNGDNLLVKNVSVGTSVGDYSYYVNRPRDINDLHGVGAFLLMCTQMTKL